MPKLAANLEWLFTESGESTADRIFAAARAGFNQVEIWGWRDKDLASIKEALDETGVQLLSLIVDPQLNLTDRNTHPQYLKAVKESAAVATELGAPNLVAVAGVLLEDCSREEQLAAVIDVLGNAAELMPPHLTLILEPLNDRVDHPGTFLSSTSLGLQIIEDVGSSSLRLLLDAYHGLMMDEDLVAEVDGRMDLVGHVQIADIPGRNQPGSGNIDWKKEIQKLVSAGYRGTIGLEYLPTEETISTCKEIRRICDELS